MALIMEATEVLPRYSVSYDGSVVKDIDYKENDTAAAVRVWHMQTLQNLSGTINHGQCWLGTGGWVGGSTDSAEYTCAGDGTYQLSVWGTAAYDGAYTSSSSYKSGSIVVNGTDTNSTRATVHTGNKVKVRLHGSCYADIPVGMAGDFYLSGSWSLTAV